MEIDIFDSVMSVPPVLAGGTKFTSIMSASHNIYETMVRESSSNSSDAVPLGCQGVALLHPRPRQYPRAIGIR
jgi:hypothetical protein